MLLLVVFVFYIRKKGKMDQSKTLLIYFIFNNLVHYTNITIILALIKYPVLHLLVNYAPTCDIKYLVKCFQYPILNLKRIYKVIWVPEIGA